MPCLATHTVVEQYLLHLIFHLKVLGSSILKIMDSCRVLIFIIWHNAVIFDTIFAVINTLIFPYNMGD